MFSSISKGLISLAASQSSIKRNKNGYEQECSLALYKKSEPLSELSVPSG